MRPRAISSRTRWRTCGCRGLRSAGQCLTEEKNCPVSLLQQPETGFAGWEREGAASKRARLASELRRPASDEGSGNIQKNAAVNLKMCFFGVAEKTAKNKNSETSRHHEYSLMAVQVQAIADWDFKEIFGQMALGHTTELEEATWVKCWQRKVRHI